MTVTIGNIETAKGSLYVALFNNENNFLEDGANPYGKIVPVKSKPTCTVEFDELPFGKYAIAVYHDLNNNGKLDKNMLGIPTEPYAFSNNPAVKWHSPTFQEAAIELRESKAAIAVELKRWRKH